jgi:hypothetical protein
MRKSKIVHLIAILMVMFLAFLMPSYAEGVEEPEVFRTYSIGLTTQPMNPDPPPPSEELYETCYSRYMIGIVVAADEEFRNVSYWTPPNNYLGWKDAALNIIERADNEIFWKYGIDFKVVGWTTWESDDTLTVDFQRLHELADELNWNPSTCGKTILIGFTGQSMEYNGKDVYGCAFIPSKNATKAALIHPEFYWADDNVVHHEISHLLGITYECHEDDCVMSDKTTLIITLISDGWVFWVDNWVPYSYLSHRWCSHCEWEIFYGKYSIIKLYANPMYGKTGPGMGKGLHEGYFPM